MGKGATGATPAKLRVFLAWSGTASRAMAEALHGWLPQVLQNVDPFMSEHIDAGARWALEIDAQLAGAGIGVLCLTPTSITSPWMFFEAGALSKQVKESVRVCPYVLGLTKKDDVPSPLSHFQSVAADKPGTFKLVKSINGALTTLGLPAERLKPAYDKWWPDLEVKLGAISIDEKEAKAAERDQGEVLSDIVDLLRGVSSSVAFLERNARGGSLGELLLRKYRGQDSAHAQAAALEKGLSDSAFADFVQGLDLEYPEAPETPFAGAERPTVGADALAALRALKIKKPPKPSQPPR